ncbi:hypothetical protein Xmir_03039 [Xenorhabdus miraniensis]|uniref:Uncharacterized protein n=1 Tax=Xenorhabdus miraniensis TaxID=351674 RepID=A0A2D0JN74_9GAMM|nr:hypothetical protein Xmir_03039 [Xenorhabdus miraniensis]
MSGVAPAGQVHHQPRQPPHATAHPMPLQCPWAPLMPDLSGYRLMPHTSRFGMQTAESDAQDR